MAFWVINCCVYSLTFRKACWFQLLGRWKSSLAQMMEATGVPKRRPINTARRLITKKTKIIFQAMAKAWHINEQSYVHRNDIMDARNMLTLTKIQLLIRSVSHNCVHAQFNCHTTVQMFRTTAFSVSVMSHHRCLLHSLFRAATPLVVISRSLRHKTCVWNPTFFNSKSFPEGRSS
jgi:hypothetical protein